MSANLSSIREKGLEVLTRKLGAADSVRFIRQFEDGSGDYTQERTQNNTIDEIAENIYKRKSKIIN